MHVQTNFFSLITSFSWIRLLFLAPTQTHIYIHIHTHYLECFPLSNMQFSTKHKKPSNTYIWTNTHYLISVVLFWKGEWMSAFFFCYTLTHSIRYLLRDFGIEIEIIRKGRTQLIKSENHVSCREL